MLLSLAITVASATSEEKILSDIKNKIDTWEKNKSENNFTSIVSACHILMIKQMIKEDGTEKIMENMDKIGAVRRLFDLPTN